MSLAQLSRQIDTERFEESLVDDLMRGKEIPAARGSLLLGDVLEGDLIFGAELAKLFDAPRAERLGLLDDLEAKARKVCERFVNEHCQEEAAQLARDADEDRAMDAAESRRGR